MEDIRERLQALADPDYRAFSLRLLPEVQPQSMLGVRLAFAAADGPAA